jgi:AraC-like DNA-binding protein
MKGTRTMYGILLDIDSIGELLEDFNTLTGIRIAFVSNNFKFFISRPSEMCRFCSILRKDIRADLKCLDCDRIAYEKAARTGSLCLYQCHAGLAEAVTPVIIDGKLSGYLMMGQALKDLPTQESWVKILHSCKQYNIDLKELHEAFFSLPQIDLKKLNAAGRIMDMSAKYIHYSKLARIQEPPLLEKIKNYIENKLFNEISISNMSRDLNMSASYLSHVIKSQFNISLTEYVRERRLEKAKQLLQQTDLKIFEIAAASGFQDQNYFSRIFKKKIGYTPVEFRTIEVKKQNSAK